MEATGLFTAMIMFCNVLTTECKAVANPELYATLEVCLKSVAEGIQATESMGPPLKVVAYQCYEWSTQKDLTDFGF